jgi:hypothetical protein
MANKFLSVVSAVEGRHVTRGFGLLLVFLCGLMLYWDQEPELYDVQVAARERAGLSEGDLVTGYVTTATLMDVANFMLDKDAGIWRGGYLSNDVAPPGILMDNVPNWEFGVLVQVRDLAKALRNDMSRSQTQSTEDQDLTVAEPQLNFDSESWLVPSTEGEYRAGIDALARYLDRLSQPDQPEAQFYARADNLADWLAIVEKRLGSLSQRLSASVGQVRINTDLSGDPEAQQSTKTAREISVKTPFLEIDDVFYEARGTCWALIMFMRAIEVDFGGVLEKKNALVSLRQIIRELEATQDTIWSPVIVNGSGFGLMANHSLVMASYVSRANAAVIDLRSLLEQG